MNIKSLIAAVLIGFFLVPCHAAYVGIHAAAASGNVEQLKKYLTDDPQLISARNGPNRTPLCIAAMCGQTEAVEFLIVQGADVNDRGFQELTPLADMAMYGTMNDHRCAEIAAILLAHGAEVDPVDGYKATPLLHAVESKKSRLAQVLMEHGASQLSRYTGAQSITTTLPLHMAIRNGDKETVAVLLNFNPPLDAVNADAQSPLILAEMLDRTEISGMIRRVTGDTNSIPTCAEMRVLGKRLADGEMSLEALAKVALELNRTAPPDINLRAYVTSPRGQLIRGRIGAAFVVVGDEAIKGNEQAFQVLKQCFDPQKRLTWCSMYGLEAFSRLAAAGNKEALDIVLQYDTDTPSTTNTFIWTDDYLLSRFFPPPRASQPTMNTYLLAPAAANIEPAVDYFVNWVSKVKPYELEGGLVMEATNSLASAAAKGNQKAQAALEKLIATAPKQNE